MTECEGAWVGDLVRDPVANRTATLTDVGGDGTYKLRAPGGAEWHTQEPDLLTVITKRADREDW